jgi:purine-cytosine permease-like protein
MIFASILSAFIETKLVGLLSTIVPVGALAFAAYQVVKRMSAKVDTIANPWAHRAAVALIAAVLTPLFAAAGDPIACVTGENCLQYVDKDKVELVVRWILGAVSAQLLFLVKNGRKK